jgi:uridine kinase
MDLIAALLDLCKASERPIIAIDGPAGAGKTTLAATIKMALAPQLSVQVIHMDDLYNGWRFALGSELTSVLEDIVKAHQDKKPYVFKKYDWSQGDFGDEQNLDSADLLILEGVGSGQRSIRENLSTLIWVDIAPVAGVARVLNRDGFDLEPQMREWLIAQSQHFRANSTQEESEFILTN